MNFKAYVQSLTYYVNEMGECDENAYNSRGEYFRDVDYITRGQDCHYIPLLEDEFNKPYISNQYQEQYFDDPSSNLNFNSRQYDKEQEEPMLAQLMSQMIATQAQQGEEIQFLISELQQEWAALKILETQLAQQGLASSQNPEKFGLQPDVSPADANTLKSGEVFEEPGGEKRASTEVVEEEKQPEQGQVKEVEEQETPYVAPQAYAPHIPFPQRQHKVPVESCDDYNVINVCQLASDESKTLSGKCTENSDYVGNNLTEVVKKSFHEGPKIIICNTRLKDEPTTSLPGH